MDKCFFRVDDINGNFSRCKALTVACCSKKCKFRKTEIEFDTGVERAEKRLRNLGLIPTIDYNKNGDRIMTVKKWGE